MTAIVKLSPRLVVDGADAAIAFYVSALGAKEITRHTNDSGAVVFAKLALGDQVIMVKDADETDPGPGRLGGTPVILTLEVDDVDALGRQMTDAGATVVFPIDDREYGMRDGRFRDPYGHLWILTRPLG